jgi:hypothetical protein
MYGAPAPLVYSAAELFELAGRTRSRPELFGCMHADLISDSAGTDVQYGGVPFHYLT